jgi:hypothetical protein
MIDHRAAKAKLFFGLAMTSYTFEKWIITPKLDPFPTIRQRTYTDRA